MKTYRLLRKDEIETLEKQSCTAQEWSTIEVDINFDPKYIHNTRFSGVVKLGVFQDEFTLAGGIQKHSGISNSTLHNVTIGDNCCIENIKNYIANYIIGNNTFIENVDIILVDGKSKFGNGVEVAVLNETGGREVYIHDRLSAHQAYIMALYRHRPQLICQMKSIIFKYAEENSSDVGKIGNNVTIVDAGYIKNVRIGDFCKIEGAGRLKNGSINSCKVAPVHIGYGVVCDDFIISSGSSLEDGTMLTRCFIGQACHLGHTYSASDSLFFSNCQEENGEACAIFAGPFTVTHHKSTLLIAGMFSFTNAGSGSNQSNHMYKLGPIHQGIMERGAKTSSDSYILWPAHVGAFSLVMGRHVFNIDSANLPFSYLIEKKNVTYLIPGVNLRSVGTIRDAQKWPKRDNRKDTHRLDQINYNLLSPYTVQKMMNGIAILKALQETSGENTDVFSYHSAKINNSSLVKGIMYYNIAIKKFLGNSIIKRLEKFNNGASTTACNEAEKITTQKRSVKRVEQLAQKDKLQEMREMLRPTTNIGLGDWVDISGLIAPKTEIDKLLCKIENGTVKKR